LQRFLPQVSVTLYGSQTFGGRARHSVRAVGCEWTRSGVFWRRAGDCPLVGVHGVLAVISPSRQTPKKCSKKVKKNVDPRWHICEIGAAHGIKQQQHTTEI
jgi:hypothetical protein